MGIISHLPMNDFITQINNWDQSWAEQFPKRQSRKQKEAFLAELEKELSLRGFATKQIRVRKIVRCTNLVTKCDAPKVIFMAHYDTPTIIPFWFSWLFRLIGHTRQISGMILMILILIAPSFLGLSTTITNIFLFIIVLSFLTLFIPNPHNREDNTSGVVGLMALADWLKDKPAIREQVQLVFTDNEELGLLGASGLKKVWHKRNHPFAEADIINIDCVTRGEIPLLVYHRQDGLVQRLRPYLQKHLPHLQTKDMTIVALSDNYVFRKSGAVDISYADKTIIPGGYYIPRIHSPADNDFNAEKLHLLIQGLTDFLESLREENKT